MTEQSNVKTTTSFSQHSEQSETEKAAAQVSQGSEAVQGDPTRSTLHTGETLSGKTDARDLKSGIQTGDIESQNGDHSTAPDADAGGNDLSSFGSSSNTLSAAGTVQGPVETGENEPPSDDRPLAR